MREGRRRLRSLMPSLRPWLPLGYTLPEGKMEASSAPALSEVPATVDITRE
jgi:hypothetical protein